MAPEAGWRTVAADAGRLWPAGGSTTVVVASEARSKHTRVARMGLLAPGGRCNVLLK